MVIGDAMVSGALTLMSQGWVCCRSGLPQARFLSKSPTMAKRETLRSSTASGAVMPDLPPDLQADFGAQPLQLGAASQTAGDSGSKAALKRLRMATAEITQKAVQLHLNRSLALMRTEDYAEAGLVAIKALEQDERSGLAWYLLAISREKTGDLGNSLKCYESALLLLPDPEMVAADLGRLAYRLNLKDIAGELFKRHLAKDPTSTEVANNLACVLRDTHRYGEAVDVLKPAIGQSPNDPLLWNTLGTVLSEQGDVETSITFFEEALRNDPHFAKARYNLGNSKLIMGDVKGALQDCETALGGKITAEEAAMMRLARSTILLCDGQVSEGWEAYEVRLDPDFADVTHFMIDRPKWGLDSNIKGKRLLIMGEQGLGDEVMFANLLPDILADLGPDGRLFIALEKRLVPLFAGSFPQAEVGPHATYRVGHHVVRGAPFVAERTDIDLWVPLASLLRKYRRNVADFPNRKHFLTPDPARVAHWQEVLKGAPAGPKVGILWKSLRMEGARLRSFSPFEQWAAVLTTPGVSFINMQYGDCAEEIAAAKALYGIEIWQPPQIDLKDDLADVGALACALDLTIGFANATTNIAAACGAPVWMISSPGAWPQLGTKVMPWYPQVRVFTPSSFQQWHPLMQAISQTLRDAYQV
jgi:tetratricopeptide (TPR) repeat protein